MNPRGLKKEEYDVVIIGAGIGGLVCGCYLAKAGMKVLIIEQNYKVGGYCQSFARDGFLFDACAHSLGSCRKNGGTITKILEDLGITDRINLKRSSPSDIIIAPDHKISFYSDLNKTITELQDIFPKESKNIQSFFDLLTSPNSTPLLSFRNETFQSVLGKYFANRKLKAILSLPVLGNVALAPSLISGFTAAVVYREFVFDGGHYPDGGMQVLPDTLASRFKELGGTLLLSHLVKKIKIENNQAKGVLLAGDDFIPAKYVISACDAVETFFDFLGRDKINKDFANKLLRLEPSLSMFIMYLGIDDNMSISFPGYTNIWYLPHYDMETLYLEAKNSRVNKLAEYYMVRILSNQRSLTVSINANFESEEFWNSHKESITNSLIRNMEKVFPSLSRHIVYKGVSTPQTLYNWTLNYKGASYGWSWLPSQMMVEGLSQRSFIKNLYLTGHWTTSGQGLPAIAYLGSNCARLILNKNKERDLAEQFNLK